MTKQISNFIFMYNFHIHKNVIRNLFTMRITNFDYMNKTKIEAIILISLFLLLLGKCL